MSGRKTRISPIQAGEVILVQPIREDLQDLYETVRDKLDEYHVAQSHADLYRREHPGKELPKELMRKLYVAGAEHQITATTFWLEVRRTYDIWEENISMRDGYTLVKSRPGSAPRGIIIGR